MKRKEYEQIQSEKRGEIETLRKTVDDNKNRKMKIGQEKQSLEMQTFKGSENLMSEAIYS